MIIKTDEKETTMNVLITGTSRGIGREIAAYFLEQEHRVFGIDKRACSITDPSYRHFVFDIRDAEGAAVPGLELLPDILINCAGVQDEDDIDVNLKGTIAMTERYGIHPGIRAVLMIGSASAHTGSEFPAYAASKGGVLSYAKNVALRIAPYGAVCNSLDLGGVKTQSNLPVTEDPVLWAKIMARTPLKRWMSEREAAEWAYFLTVTNRFCTGQNILVDGLEAGDAHFIWPAEGI